jgi:hypothetical protein
VESITYVYTDNVGYVRYATSWFADFELDELRRPLSGQSPIGRSEFAARSRVACRTSREVECSRQLIVAKAARKLANGRVLAAGQSP